MLGLFFGGVLTGGAVGEMIGSALLTLGIINEAGKAVLTVSSAITGGTTALMEAGDAIEVY